MRKLIDIKEEDVQPLKMMAVLANKDLKNYIQDVLSEKIQTLKNNTNEFNSKPHTKELATI